MPDTSMTEYLCIRGWHGRDRRFHPLRSYSTTTVRRWPQGTDGYTVEILDAEGAVLLREPADAEARWPCEPGGDVTWKVVGYIALVDRAARVRLVGPEDVLYDVEIPEAPTIRLSWTARKVQRGDTISLTPTLSRPATDAAWLDLVLQWGERRYRTLGFYTPDTPIELNTRELPGGERCRLVLGYSNGVRSVSTATRWFELEPLPTKLTIDQPAASDVMRPWQPIELRGRIHDPQQPRQDDDALTWQVFDESKTAVASATGAVTGIDPLPAGIYRLQLSLKDATLVKDQVLTVRNQRGVDRWADRWDDRTR